MEKKAIEIYTKQIDGRVVTGLAAIFGNIDAYGDITHKGAFKKTIQENFDRVRHLWQHDNWSPPIATVKSLREVGKGDLPKEVKEKFPEATGGLEVVREYLDTPRANEVFTALTAEPPAIREMSFGYDPIKFDFESGEDGPYEGMLIRNLREVRLYDTSDVNWGANEATVASKAAVPFKDTGAADEDTAWSAPTLGDFTEDAWGDLSDAEKRRIASHYAWAAAMPPENFGDLKLPHHQPGMSGVGPAVWRGVASAMGRLLQSGTQIPDSDRRGVYNHLSKHYAQWDKEVPDFKLVELAMLSQEVLTLETVVGKEGHVLSSRNLERLKNALDVLSEILLAAEPPEDEDEKAKTRALTESLMRRVQIAEREQFLISVR